MADLSWGLSITAKDRIDLLERCVTRALVQTVPPREVPVADHLAEWEARGGDRIAKRAPDQSQTRAAGRPLMWLDVLKDGLSSRLSFPQTRGFQAAFNGTGKIFAQTPEESAATYPDLQQRILKGGRDT